ncbi:hypothetical protein [Parafrankia sp. EUN1f]|uniref:hypothetical protein n=1 Tax=Parafrankia sp. EUN1f TaxID=102897 RepID=UPI0012F9761D|nr:hypothetical protein [Parafrankia sp. EUN1f]
MSDLPDAVRRQLITEIYRRADELDWDGLTQVDRSATYNRWLDDPTIGEVLAQFVPRERARLWIKDVPMKNYDRARHGIGPYAQFATRRLPGPDYLVHQEFGPEWSINTKSLREKPSRCLITDGRTRKLLIWGNPSNFRALIWAGLNARIDGGPTPVIVVSVRQGQRLTEGEIARHVLLGGQAGIEVRHTVIRELPRMSGE